MNYSRADKLFILASVCNQNKITPDHPAYMGLIIKVATSKLSMSIESAKEYATDLTAAYSADKWQTITTTTEETEAAEPSEPAQVEPEPPMVNSFKTLQLTQPLEPIKTVPTKTVYEPELSPKTTAQILLRLAHQDDFNGVGRLTLAQVRYELQDKSLQLQDITRLLNQYAPQSTIETRPGNTILIYFDGKDTIKYNRQAMRMIQPEPSVFKQEKPRQLTHKREAEEW